MNERRHYAGLAAVLSFLFNGLGQLYNGQINKGLWIMTLSALSMILIITSSIFIGHWVLSSFLNLKEIIISGLGFILGIVLASIVGIYSIFDAYNVAIKH